MGSYAGLLNRIKEAGYSVFRAKLVKNDLKSEVSYEGFYVKPPQLQGRFNFFTFDETKKTSTRITTGTITGVIIETQSETILETKSCVYKLIDEGTVV